MALVDPPCMHGFNCTTPGCLGNNSVTIAPYNTVTAGYLSTGVTELKKRVTIRKFDADGNVIEETVTEEYGDKEIVTIPTYPTNPSPWYQPVSPTWDPNRIYCGSNTNGVDYTASGVVV